MQVEHPLLRDFPQLREQVLEQIATDPLIAHLAADYELLEARLKQLQPESDEFYLLHEEFETLKDGLRKQFQPPRTGCCGRCQKVSCGN